MGRDVQQEFQEAFSNFWNTNKLDFAKLGGYFSSFNAEEQKKEARLYAPNSKVLSFLSDLKENVDEENFELIYGSFNDLFKKSHALTEFLDEHGYEHIDDPEIKELIKFINGLQILGMQHGFGEEYSFYKSFEDRINYLDAEEKEVYENMIKFYAALSHDGIKPNELMSDYEYEKNIFDKIQTQIAGYENNLEEFETVDEDIKSIGTKLADSEALKQADDDVEFYEENYKYFLDKNDKKKIPIKHRQAFIELFDYSAEEQEELLEIPNAEFTEVVKDYLDNAVKNSKKYLEEQLAHKIKLKETFDKKTTQKYLIDSKVDLQYAKEKLKKYEKHVQKAQSFQKRVDEITSMRDLLYSDVKVEKKPNRFELLEKSLTDIKAKFGKVKKRSKNSPEFNDMYNNIDETIKAIQTGDVNVAMKALENLDNKTMAYTDAKNNQTRWFPTTLRKLRLQTSEELHNLCSQRDLIGEDMGDIRDKYEHFKMTYKPGNSANLGKELMTKAKKQYEIDSPKYVEKIDHAEVEREIMNMQANLLVK